ncbi:MAG: hypothetical protein AAF754_05940 [Pseudomonadota bacterium]
MTRFLMAALLFVSACNTELYDTAPGDGFFTGSLLVMWVDAGSGDEGDGRFVYVPDTRGGKGLTFHRGGAAGDVTTITPGLMYTDGGSIPRLLQPFNGLNPWGYAPAYMAHDWLFVARKCLNDDIRTPEYKALESLEFDDSVRIMAEAVKALESARRVSDADIDKQAITLAVSSSISQRRWNETGACETNKVTPEHVKQIQARLNIGIRSKIASVMVDGERVAPADIVGQISF